MAEGMGKAVQRAGRDCVAGATNQAFYSRRVLDLKVPNKPFFYKSWFHAGVKDVKDLLNDSNYNFLS